MSRMAPVSSQRQLWVWGSLVVLLSFVWYKRKRNTHRSDPGGTLKLLPHPEESRLQEPKVRPKLQGKEPSSPVSALTCEPDSPIDAVRRSEKIDTVAASSIEESVTKQVSAPLGSAIASDHSSEQSDVVVASCSPLKPEAQKSGEEKCIETSAQETEAVLNRSEDEEVKEEISEESSTSSEEVVSTSDEMKDTKQAEVPVASTEGVKDDGDKVASLEGKLASLALGSSEEQRRGAERDSANHSPVDAMLASPSISSYSDEHSEGSSDSGKGCSDVASPPSRTPVGSGSLAGDADGDNGVESTNGYSVYDFLLPQLLVGRLIGRHGAFVHEIKAKTNATIWIKKHPETSKQKICSVEGTPADIDSALALIRQRFPLSKYPNVTLEQISVAPVPTVFPLVPDFCQLYLVEGVNNEVMISSLVSPAHMFVQQPYHPSYQFLQRLNHMMNSIYANVETPNLPDPIEAGNICVAPAVDGWYRAQVVSSNEETQTSEIKFVDYGGYMVVNNSVLRQIRQDFMTLPFQATECYLANIKPSGESGEWSPEAHGIVEELTRGQMLLAQVYDYAADGVPLIYLYSSVNSQVVLINQELVARGMADVDESVVSSTSAEAASLVVAAKAVAAAAAGETSSQPVTETSGTSSTTVENEDKTSAVKISSASEVAAN